MKPTEIRYDLMVEYALRKVVEDALKQVERHGFPGEHHFYITFRTDHPYVEVPEYLKTQYPDEMTVVIQYEYDDLLIEDGNIAITLSFDDRSEHIKFPIEAITTFADPAVNFALQFQSFANYDDNAEDLDELELELIENQKASSKQDKNSKKTKTKKDSQKDGEVVSLDSFRKKQKKK